MRDILIEGVKEAEEEGTRKKITLALNILIAYDL